jgi:hypothetical protein
VPALVILPHPQPLLLNSSSSRGCRSRLSVIVGVVLSLITRRPHFVSILLFPPRGRGDANDSPVVLGVALLSAPATAVDPELAATYTLMIEIAKVNPIGAGIAFVWLDCNLEVVKAVGKADRLTPAAVVAESMARAAAAKCVPLARSAARVLSPEQVKAITAQILKANAEVALDASPAPCHGVRAGSEVETVVSIFREYGVARPRRRRLRGINRVAPSVAPQHVTSPQPLSETPLLRAGRRAGQIYIRHGSRVFVI